MNGPKGTIKIKEYHPGFPTASAIFQVTYIVNTFVKLPKMKISR